MQMQFSRWAWIGLVCLLAGCGGGGGGGGAGSSPDTTPAAFSFTAQTGTLPSTAVTSNDIVISDINTSAPISITGGEYSIDGGAFTSAPGTVANNQRVSIRATSSTEFASTVTVVLTIGGVSASFTITTAERDDTVDAFQFQRIINATRGTQVTSNSVTIAGINVPVSVSVDNGEYSIDGGAFTSTAGSIRAGQSLTVRVRTSTTYSKVTVARVTVGSVTADLEVLAEVPSFIPDRVVFDGQDIVYLLNSGNGLVLRWSLAQERYLDAYVVGVNGVAPSTMAYSSSHQRLYLGYGTGAIQYIDAAAGTGGEIAFANIGGGVGGLLAVGNYLWAESANYYNASHYTFDSNGAQTGLEQNWSTYTSQEVAWDPVTSRVYTFRDNYYPNDLIYESINPSTGQITRGTESPYHGTYTVQAPIRVSANGQHVLLGSGDIYNQTGLTWARSIGGPITDARWFADGSLVTLSTVDNRTTLRHRAAANFANLEQLTYAGMALRVVGTDTRMAVLVIEDSTVRFHIYVPTDDTDGDGVANPQDAFPLDPSASLDTDRDGYPDAWNTGRGPSDSTSGLSLDAYPQDAGCYLDSHGNGSGGCNYSATIPNYVPDQVIHSGDTVYLLSSANRRVYRWSIASASYLDPYVVGLDRGSSTLAPIKMTYSSSHQRLYLGYSTGAIQYIDVTGGRAEVPFAVTARELGGLAAVGNYLFAQDYGSYRANDYVFNRGGVLTDLKDWYNYNPSEYTWDPVNSRVYFLSSGSPGTLYYVTIDQSTGQLTTRGEPPYFGFYDSSPAPVRVSSSGESILVGSGDIYSRTGLTWLSSLGGEIADARWFSNGSLVSVSTANDVTTLNRRGTSLALLEQRTYAGRALRVVGSDTRMAVLVVDGATVRFHIYVPNDDSDGDGVSNTQDAFPHDPAASVDTDHDGYPDSWNSGRGPSDSTTGLSEDAYPQDSGCYLSSHGTGATCNYSAAIPNYLPEEVVQNGDTVYLLSTANRRVYRWSIATASYLNPYVVGLNPIHGAPISMTYSSAHQRLYLGYSTGAIQYIDVTSGNNAVEVAFGLTPRSVRDLVPSANHLVAQDEGPPWSAPYILDRNGAVTSRGNHGYSTEYAWDPVNSRVYFFRDYFPSDLVYQTIDPTSGQITSSGETPYNFVYTFQAPIRPSASGQYVLLGSGDIYNRNGLTWAGSVGALIDAHWFADNSVAVLRTANNQTTLRRLSTSLATLDQRTYSGTALRVLGSDTRLAVLVNNNGAVQFHIYAPSDDTDGDGVSNTQDAFPLDVAASVDTDRDGYPDAWNLNRNASDSTTGLSLDAYSQDAECYLTAHGAGGDCNYGATMPSYVPDQVLSVGDTVYLLSNANRRVYRWSMATRAYLKPYSVRIDSDFNTVSPIKMAYSSDHERLYLGYSSGTIQYIDLTLSSGASVQFASIAGKLEGLAAAGNYVFMQNRADVYSTATHYVIDTNGVTTDQEPYTYSSSEYTWDPVSSRLYFFNDNYSYAGDLHYQVISQTTGQITTKGNATQYPLSYTLQPPIRVAADGQAILIGNGDIYTQPNLTRAGGLGKVIKDARWTDHALVDVDTTDRVEIRDLQTRAVLASYQYLGQPIALVFGQSEAFLVHVLNNTTVFNRLAFGDQDGDSMPEWWEQLYASGGLSDSNAADALGDPDGDGVSNADEYLHNSNPIVVDSDGDGLSDHQEIGTYFTEPSRADTDRDGLDDQAEIVTHQTNPLVVDSDGDGYSDYDEVLYGGNPNNQTSVPQPLTSYNQSFENNPDLSAWSTPEYSNTDWTVDSTVANTGAASLRSGSITYGQTSSVRFRGFFTAGQLSFHARIDSEHCCDYIIVLVDGVERTYLTSWNQWSQYTSIPITLGVHTIEWRYERNMSYPQAPGVAHIDDVVFAGQ